MKAIKVTVDGPREPRSKIRHQNFHPFAFGPQRFAPDPLMTGLPFKLPGNFKKPTLLIDKLEVIRSTDYLRRAEKFIFDSYYVCRCNNGTDFIKR